MTKENHKPCGFLRISHLSIQFNPSFVMLHNPQISISDGIVYKPSSHHVLFNFGKLKRLEVLVYTWGATLMTH